MDKYKLKFLNPCKLYTALRNCYIQNIELEGMKHSGNSFGKNMQHSEKKLLYDQGDLRKISMKK